MAEPLLLEKNGAVATITFNKPEKANAMDIKWLAPMTAFLRDVEHDAAIRCVLIRGNGKHFMAGGDLDLVNSFLTEPPERRAVLAEAPIHEYNVMVRTMRRLNQPIIASVQGGVAGAAGVWSRPVTWPWLPTTHSSSWPTFCMPAVTTD